MNLCMTFLGEILPSLGTETKTFTLGYSLGDFLRASLQLQDDALSLMTFRYCSLPFLGVLFLVDSIYHPTR